MSDLDTKQKQEHSKHLIQSALAVHALEPHLPSRDVVHGVERVEAGAAVCSCSEMPSPPLRTLSLTPTFVLFVTGCAGSVAARIA